MEKLQALFMEMTAFDAGVPERIHHFTKVHNFARMIGIGEHLSPTMQYVLEAAAIVHDIGIKPSLEKYGNCHGPNQELEGPPIAGQMMTDLGFSVPVIDRACYLVGHHHTYNDIDGLDYQILVEADFLVNLVEGHSDQAAVTAAYETIFQTETGKAICRSLFPFLS